jgi:hypothetical protein
VDLEWYPPSNGAKFMVDRTLAREVAEVSGK